eukprot:GEMP01022707.1.p1 GENE.GEMP01022707.1~~GEMP01022707.1.p1  ORF type:complete len:674 (+),score=171.89 GEMP01022707.1:215-2236(+)
MSNELAWLEKEFLTAVKADSRYQGLQTSLLMGNNLGFLGYQNILHSVLVLSWNWMKPYVKELCCLRTRVSNCEKKRRQASLMHMKDLSLSHQLMSRAEDKYEVHDIARDVTFFDAMMFEDEEMREIVQLSVLKLWDHISSSGKDGGEGMKLQKPELLSKLEKFEERPGGRLGGPASGDGVLARSGTNEDVFRWEVRYEQALMDAEEQKKRYEEIIETLRQRNGNKNDGFNDEAPILTADSPELAELKSELAAARLEVEQLKQDAASRVEAAEHIAQRDGASASATEKDNSGLNDDASPDARINAMKGVKGEMEGKMREEIEEKMREEMENKLKKEIEAKLKVEIKEKMKEESKEETQKLKKDMKALQRIKDAQIADLSKRLEESAKELADGSSVKVKRVLVEDSDRKLEDASADERERSLQDEFIDDVEVPTAGMKQDDYDLDFSQDGEITGEENQRKKLMAELQQTSPEKKDMMVRIMQLEAVVGEMTQKLHEFRKMLGNQVGDATMAAKLEDIFDEVGLSDLMKCSSDAKVFERLYSDAMHRLNRLEIKRMRCMEELKQVTLRLIESRLLLSTEKELYVGQRRASWQCSDMDRGKRASSAGGYQRKESMCPEQSKRRSTRIRITDEYYRAHLQRSGQVFPPEEPCQLETRAITPQVLPNLKSLTHLVKYGK